MSVQNEVIAEGTNKNHEADWLPNEKIDNDEINEDGSFDLSIATGETDLAMEYNTLIL